jgi:hypothetical protein
MRFAIYTALCGPGRDELRPTVPIAGAHYVAFTDRHPPGSWVYGWEIVAPAWTHPDPRRSARYHKILSHVVLPDSNAWLWVDASMQVQPPANLVDQHGAELVHFPHFMHDCVYQEHAACERYQLDDAAPMRAQVERYRAAGYPEHNGLAETGILFRRNTTAVRRFNENWWEEVCCYSVRDQLSFDFTLWRSETPPVRVRRFQGTVYDTPIARHHPHQPLLPSRTGDT